MFVSTQMYFLGALESWESERILFTFAIVNWDVCGGVLQSLRELYEVLPEAEDDYEVSMQIAKRVWIACNDGEESIQLIAKS